VFFDVVAPAWLRLRTPQQPDAETLVAHAFPTPVTPDFFATVAPDNLPHPIPQQPEQLVVPQPAAPVIVPIYFGGYAPEYFLSSIPQQPAASVVPEFQIPPPTPPLPPAPPTGGSTVFGNAGGIMVMSGGGGGPTGYRGPNTFDHAFGIDTEAAVQPVNLGGLSESFKRFDEQLVRAEEGDPNFYAEITVKYGSANGDGVMRMRSKPMLAGSTEDAEWRRFMESQVVAEMATAEAEAAARAVRPPIPAKEKAKKKKKKKTAPRPIVFILQPQKKKEEPTELSSVAPVVHTTQYIVTSQPPEWPWRTVASGVVIMVGGFALGYAIGYGINKIVEARRVEPKKASATHPKPNKRRTSRRP